MSGFVHLHVHSEYSLLDGAARIEELAAEAAKLGMSALALTDHGAMYGVVPFYKACVKHGVKPILGCELYVAEGSMKDKLSRQEQRTWHLILLAKNRTGYENLMELVSRAHLDGFHYKPRVDFALLSRHAEGLICLSACLGGEVAQHVLHDRYEEAKQTALRYKELFGDDYYLELQDHGMLEQKKVNQGIIRLSGETGIPLVATNDVHYLHAEDYEAQDILICIGTGKTVDDESRLKFHSNQMYLRTAGEMEELFHYVPEALANTAAIAEACSLELVFGQSILPAFEPLPEGSTAPAYLMELCQEGLAFRYQDRPEWQDPAWRKQVEERLRYELAVIERMGYSDYFLIVWDFIRFAHQQGIAVGPGRGSSAGSLVAYVLRITDVDPIRYNLLFERFLNPERVSMPDIDIDFSDERRDEVIGYVVAKYGRDRVAQIITFGTMAAKAAVRDVGRVLNLPYSEVDRTAKMIPFQLGITLDDALKLNPELHKQYVQNPRIGKLLDLARRVEGMPRHASTHAAGVVISRERLTRHVPLQEGTDGTPLTQFAMENLEAVGLLKMDFLGLRTLSIIERTLRWLEEYTGKPVRFGEVPDSDPATYELMSRGDTTGVFQLESAGIRRVLRDLKPSGFEDVISVVALYRPGPMEFIPKYIAGKHGQIQVEYPHPNLEPILKDTYGIIVYQEQIMQIASRMAGFSLGEADLLRRAVSKKKREVLDQERKHFVAGSVGLGYTEEEANRVYDMIVRFADYGFPRAHATAYGVLAFRTAYLKAHYPVFFMASMLTAVIGSHRKVAEYVDDCRRLGIAVLPPDVNESGVAFTPVPRTEESEGQEAGEASALPQDKRGRIRFGLAAIKNVGTQAIESIRRERAEGGPFENLLDFCRRVDLRVCNKRVIESLIQSGAMDSLPGHRAQQLAMLEDTVEAALKWKKEREDLQLHLFGFTEEPNWHIEYPDIPPYSTQQILELERELLGLYLTGHPLDDYEERLTALGSVPLYQLAELPDESLAVTAGRVVSLKTIITKKGQMMAFAEVEDRIERLELVLFPETWKRFGNFVEKGSLLLIGAKLQHQDEEEGVKLLAERLEPLSADFRPERYKNWLGRAGEPRQERPAVAAGSRAAPRTPRVQTGAVQEGSTVYSREAGGGRGGTQAQAPGNTAGGKPPGAGSGAAPAASRTQRLFIKISEDKEKAGILPRLEALLKSAKGPLETVLFYEREQRLLALSDQYRVRPSPELIESIDQLLGAGSAKIK
ncbi:DNA polymerase III subunit alpha [Paenibacillus sp. YN15]|uniref:DNA polymerase III subunit alpha n=1 Tax=Paenibacillus sp. YN15 TaxID=1742774 RepID=UPI000DCE7D0F|nr:DNA polymerase III subunit alpha [Paenibacillus sp. YN15]RAV06566.1 DNA polymerase III subunit alpha [Paenibacillus sp. YN15]